MWVSTGLVVIKGRRRSGVTIQIPTIGLWNFVYHIVDPQLGRDFLLIIDVTGLDQYASAQVGYHQ